MQSDVFHRNINGNKDEEILVWESPLMTTDIRVGRGVQDSPQNRTR